MTNDAPGFQAPAARGRIFKRFAIAGVLIGAAATVAGLVVVGYCAYVSWHRIDTVPAKVAGNAADITSYFESIQSVAVGAVGVTVAGAAVLVASLLVLPGRRK